MDAWKRCVLTSTFSLRDRFATAFGNVDSLLQANRLFDPWGDVFAETWHVHFFDLRATSLGGIDLWPFDLHILTTLLH